MVDAYLSLRLILSGMSLFELDAAGEARHGYRRQMDSGVLGFQEAPVSEGYNDNRRKILSPYLKMR